MGRVIPFPGVDPASVCPPPTSLEDLPAGALALVVTREGARFAVDIWPPLNGEQPSKRAFFGSLREALQFARRSRACWPKMFQLVLNETGRQTSSELLGSDPDPMGLRLRR